VIHSNILAVALCIEVSTSNGPLPVQGRADVNPTSKEGEVSLIHLVGAEIPVSKEHLYVRYVVRAKDEDPGNIDIRTVSSCHYEA
jgi:hypothetical protein